jgi:methyl-accepting chemotaxis protein
LLSKQGLLEEATALSLRQGEPAFRKIMESLNDLTELNRIIASDVRETAQTSSQQAKMFMAAIPIVTAGIILFLSVVIVRSITRPLQGLGQVSSRLADGDLGQRAQVNRSELGALAYSFNQMAAALQTRLETDKAQAQHLQKTVELYTAYLNDFARGNLSRRITLRPNGQGQNDPLLVLDSNIKEMAANLQNMIGQIHDAANSLATASSEILSATTQQASGAIEQSAAISQTTTTVEEVKIIAEQSSRRAQEVTGVAQRTIEVSRAGQTAVQQSIESMAQIKVRVEGIAENIMALSKQTQQIGAIITTVNDIAAQSNMLALNASVEAARAGEHGKGFAVVAVEVRNLAEQSHQATAQVRTILAQI